MNFKQFLIENVARTNALKQQQELIDAGYEVKVTKQDDFYELDAAAHGFSSKYYFCLSDGRVVEYHTNLNHILRNPHTASKFIENVLQKRWPAGEKIIATNGIYAYAYAEDYLGDPFPAGEAAIAEQDSLAYSYALRVLKGRFPAGEPAIAAGNGYYAYLYALHVIEGPWPPGEEAIMTRASESIKCDYQEYKANHEAS